MRETFLFLIDDQVDAALGPARHRLGFVLSGLAESQPAKERTEFVRSSIVDGELDELDAEASRSRRHLRNRDRRFAAAAAQLIHQINQRALAIERNCARRASAKLIIEYFERNVPPVSGRLHRRHEVEQREVALPR